MIKKEVILNVELKKRIFSRIDIFPTQITEGIHISLSYIGKYNYMLDFISRNRKEIL